MLIDDHPAEAAPQPNAVEARNMLESLRDRGFDGSVGDTALALGRDEEYVSGALDGDEEIDDDLIIKIRGLAQERNIPIQ